MESKHLQNNEQGFTLLELMVVVGIMAILGSALVTTYSGQGEGSIGHNSKVQAARFEMQQLRKSLLQYKQDNIDFPDTESPADVSFLFTKSNDTAQWSIDYQIGWRGPYMSGGDAGLVDVGDGLNDAGASGPHIISSAAVTLQRAIPDPFTFYPVKNGQSKSDLADSCIESSVNNKCLLDWRLVGQSNNALPQIKYGRPYLLFDLAVNEKARIVSMGANGIYEGSVVSICTPKFSKSDNSDDLILCLY
jgi:prepilin-type N-terminal cleavage/methylation domain-containing protein